MALTPRLDLRQSQSLVMTPQLQQAIKLLQLSNIELTAYVAEELEKNPLLDVDDGSESSDAQSKAESNGADAEQSQSGEDTSEITAADQAMSQDQASGETETALDADRDSLYTDEARADVQSSQAAEFESSSTDWSSVKGGGKGFDSDLSGLESTLSQEVTLRDHLIEQLHVSIKDPAQKVIGIHLIDMLDDAGYLVDAIDVIAERLGASIAYVQETLEILQKFEPAGLFCRDLSECLALQLIDRDRFDPAMKALIENLDLLAKRELSKLEKICEVDREDISDMIQEIRELDPKPGLAFSSVVAQTVIPDVFVKKTADGGWRVELNSDTLPRVLLNQRYYAEITKLAQSKDDKSYMTDCYNDANWLIKSLDQRAKTILKVSTEIVRQQDAFMIHGVQHLRPLNLKTVAEAISMHESTVSRVTTNKYMSTHRGVFELKYFFTSAIASSHGGDAHSAEAVRDKIKKLIEIEDISTILSDDKIVDILKGQGIDIARRTVAKYREAMHIPSSVQRRRLKKEPA